MDIIFTLFLILILHMGALYQAEECLWTPNALVNLSCVTLCQHKINSFCCHCEKSGWEGLLAEEFPGVLVLQQKDGGVPVTPSSDKQNGLIQAS